MKKILQILFLSLCIISCSAQKVGSKITYFLPSDVRIKILEKLKTIKEPEKISFVLGNDELGNYIIYLNNHVAGESKFWVENTNRVLFLEDKFYPLIFEADEYFSYPENTTSILKKMDKGEPIRKIITIRENSFFIKFKLNGEIIK